MTLTELELKKHDLINTEESKRKKESYLKALEIIERKAREQLQTTNCWIKLTAENILEIIEIKIIPEPLEKLLAIYHRIESNNGSLGPALESFCKEIGDLIKSSKATLCNHCLQIIFRSQPYEKFDCVRYHLHCYQEKLEEDRNYQKYIEENFPTKKRSVAE